MTLIDHLATVSLRPGARMSVRPGARMPVPPGARTPLRPSVQESLRPVAPAAGPLPGELEEADQLIADLAALVDAGLVTVRRQLGGPARYGATVDRGDAA